jgi:hypothetical protein
MQRGIVGAKIFDNSDVPWVHETANPTVALLTVSYF